MDKKCCTITVTELEKGYRFEVLGDDLKEKSRLVFENCCTQENLKQCISACCKAK